MYDPRRAGWNSELNYPATYEQDVENPYRGDGSSAPKALRALSGYGDTSTPESLRATLIAAVEDVGQEGIIYCDVAGSIGTSPVDLKGATLIGKMLSFDTGVGEGPTVLNHPARERVLHFGHEYIFNWLNKITTSTQARVAIVGDSNASDFAGTILRNLLATIPNVTVLDRTISGTQEHDWLNGTGLFAPDQPGGAKSFASVMDEEPDLLINMYSGTNDAFNGRTLQQSLDTKVATIAAIRAHPNGAFGKLGIVLMSASSHRDAGGRDQHRVAVFGEAVRAMCDLPSVEAAYFDRLGIAVSNTADSGVEVPAELRDKWLDNYGVHPINSNALMTGFALYDFVFPEALRREVMGTVDYGSGENPISDDLMPNDFSAGITINRSGNAYPHDGFVATLVPQHSGGSFALQINWQYTTTAVSMRVGQLTEWFDWVVVGTQAAIAEVVPSDGFQHEPTERMSASRQGQFVIAGGYLALAVPGPLAEGDEICALPSGFETASPKWACNVVGWLGGGVAADQFVPIKARLYLGKLVVTEDMPQTIHRVYLEDSWLTA